MALMLRWDVYLPPSVAAGDCSFVVVVDVLDGQETIGCEHTVTGDDTPQEVGIEQAVEILVVHEKGREAANCLKQREQI